MNAARIETLAWVLIYAGLLALCLGWFVAPRSDALGAALMTGGAALAGLGVALVVVRSRMKP